MRVVILTSSRKGTASYCLWKILQETKVEVPLVIYNEGVIANKRKYYTQKIRKTMKIGFLGALNGIRMRKWYSHENHPDIKLEDIELICTRNNIRFEKTSAINTQRTRDLMASADPDLGLSLGNGYIGSKVFSIPKKGMINIHGEILPQFQNAQSVIWQIYENSHETGYTIHKIDKKIDTGDIIKQERFPILFKESLSETVRATSGEILKRAADGLVDVLNNFDRYYQSAIPQGKGRHYTTPGFFQFLRIRRAYLKLRSVHAHKQ